MSINIIAAISKNFVIGKKNGLPWNIPKDLKYFKKLTNGRDNAVLMGRKTWDSLPRKPLPNRGNIVITQKNVFRILTSVYNNLLEPSPFTQENDRIIEPSVYNNIENIDLKQLQKIHPNIWICGGQSIYEYYINKPYIDHLYLTEIDTYVEGDIYFPKIPNKYKKIKESEKFSCRINALKYVNVKHTIYKNVSND